MIPFLSLGHMSSWIAELGSVYRTGEQRAFLCGASDLRLSGGKTKSSPARSGFLGKRLIKQY